MKVIGLMSGTSLDGIDAAIAEITGRDLDLNVRLLEAHTYPYPAELKQRILRACHNEPLTIAQLAQLDDDIATQFAIAANQIQTRQITAELIGSHGQTVYHRPPKIETGRLGDWGTGECQEHLTLGYSMQLGRGEVIANLTSIPTVSNFRAADIAAGGQGAPLVSKIDVCLLTHPTKYRVVQNLGGIGNLTYLPPRNCPNWESKICGWDTGPANVLIDLAIQKLTDGEQNYDRNGEYAARGKPCRELIQQWLEQDYFVQSPPKSTGRELFNRAYLDRCWQQARDKNLSNPDWLATITELTVASIVHSYRNFLPQIPEEVLLCGGGSRNCYMRQRLQAELTSAKILTTDEVGLNGDYKEAIAFAILAYWRYQCQFPGNLTQVTSAKKPMLLGEIHRPQF